MAVPEGTGLGVDLEPAFHAEPIIASVGPEARTQSELYQPTDVIAGRSLRELGKNSLGEPLSSRPGINSTFYGPGASRPEGRPSRSRTRSSKRASTKHGSNSPR